MENLKTKTNRLIAGVAIAITSIQVNSTCMRYMHQPKMPKEAERLLK